MGQEYAKKWAKRHPKGAANSMHYTLLVATNLPHSTAKLSLMAQLVLESTVMKLRIDFVF